MRLILDRNSIKIYLHENALFWDDSSWGDTCRESDYSIADNPRFIQAITYLGKEGFYDDLGKRINLGDFGVCNLFEIKPLKSLNKNME